MCFSYVTWVSCSLIIWGQMVWGHFSLLTCPLKNQVTRLSKQQSKSILKQSSNCFICLVKITIFCKCFHIFHSGAPETLPRLEDRAISYSFCWSCFHQVGIRVFSTASSVIGQRQTFQNTFLSSTTSAASPSTLISQHSSSEWDLAC